MAGKATRARSLYKGIRITMTQSPDGGVCVVTMTTKDPRDAWNEWTLLYPGTRVPSRPISSAEDAMRFLHDFLTDHLSQDG